jgi:MauM/NapG family ferredoxin protein
MKAKTGKTVQRIRILVQVLFAVLFFYLLLQSGYAHATSFTFTDYFFYIDPLLLLMNFLATGTIVKIFLLSLIPFFLTFVLGRFFCGWVCPMGTIHQFFSWLFARANKKKKKKEEIDKRLLKLKYVILLILVVSALMGTHLVGWLDPFSVLTRSTALVVNPSINYTVHQGLKQGAQDEGIVAKGLKPLYKFARKNILTIKQRYYTQSVFVGLIFFGLIMLNMYKRRFFCNYLCPLGALYGLVSKFSLFNLKTNKECISCKACANNCTYNGSPFENYMKTECMTCFNCVDDCPTDAVDVSFAPPKKENRTTIDIGRRTMMGSAVSALFAATLPRFFVHAKPKMIHRFLRPPGSVKETEFLEKCVRCGQCMHVCPTNFIQPAFLEAGLEGLWTPILNAQTGYCEFECDKCLQVCPTNAIETLDLDKKKKFKMGIAVVDKDRCYTYADGYNCAVCEEHCPIPEKAIRFREVDTWNFKGKLVKVKQIYIVPDLCTGCGICENKCPRSDAPGIIMTSEEEDREFQYDYY